MWRTKNNIVCLPDMYTNIRRENFLYNFIKKFLTQFSLYINIYSVRKSWPHRISTLFSYIISCAQYIYSPLVHSEISPYNIKCAKMTSWLCFYSPPFGITKEVFLFYILYI